MSDNNLEEVGRILYWGVTLGDLRVLDDEQLKKFEAVLTHWSSLARGEIDHRARDRRASR